MPARRDLHARFLAVVQRGLERADREEREYRASLRPMPRQSQAERQRVHGTMAGFRGRRRS